MKTFKYPICLTVIFFSLASTSYADVFGTDDKKWERVFSDLKKISIRLTDNVDVQLKSLQANQAEVLRLIDGFKGTIPTLQGAIEQNDAKTTQLLSRMESRLAELEGRTKAHLEEQKKNQTEALNALKLALAADMENLAKQLVKNSNDSIGSINSGFANLDSNNKKMIDILAKTLQENQETGKAVGLASKKMGEVDEHLNLTREMVTKLKEIVSTQSDHNSKNVEKLAETLKVIQAQSTAAATSIQQMEEKVNQSILKSDPINANLDLANQKLSKLIEILKAFASEQEKIVKGQQAIADSLGQSKEEAEPKKSGKSQKKSSTTHVSKSKKSQDE